MLLVRDLDVGLTGIEKARQARRTRRSLSAPDSIPEHGQRRLESGV